jgi:hypothetical protein
MTPEAPTKNGQAQLSAWLPCACSHYLFQSQTSGSMDYPICDHMMLFHVELAWSDQEDEINDTWQISRSGPLPAQHRSAYKRHKRCSSFMGLSLPVRSLSLSECRRGPPD